MYYPNQPLYDGHYVHQQPVYFFPPSNPLMYQPLVDRQYPDVDPSLFHQSAVAFQQLINDASLIISSISGSDQLAFQLMDAAQKNQTEKVKQFIQSTGIQSDVKVDFNPDQLHLTLLAQVEGIDCCILRLAIRWR